MKGVFFLITCTDCYHFQIHDRLRYIEPIHQGKCYRPDICREIMVMEEYLWPCGSTRRSILWNYLQENLLTDEMMYDRLRGIQAFRMVLTT